MKEARFEKAVPFEVVEDELAKTEAHQPPQTVAQDLLAITSPPAELVVRRTKQVLGSAGTFVLNLDRKTIGFIDSGEVKRFYVTPGKYKMHVEYMDHLNDVVRDSSNVLAWRFSSGARDEFVCKTNIFFQMKIESA